MYFYPTGKQERILALTITTIAKKLDMKTEAGHNHLF